MGQIKNKLLFDSIIMECTDILSIETEVKKAYDKLVNKKTISPIYYKDGYWIRLFIMEIIFLISSSLLWYLCFKINPYLQSGVLGIPTVGSSFFLVILSGWIIDGKIKGEWGINKKSKIKKHDKFEILKSAYIGTIAKLVDRLDLVKDKIDSQINLHEKDREEIKEYADILSNTDEALGKIETTIKKLRDSKLKVSDKKAEINQLLNRYIGENGYITQKEAEIKRIKVAQELSDRMKNNFQTTMEIINNVDILTDAIIPAIKELIGFKIPELISNIEFECDKNRVLLEMKA